MSLTLRNVPRLVEAVSSAAAAGAESVLIGVDSANLEANRLVVGLTFPLRDGLAVLWIDRAMEGEPDLAERIRRIVEQSILTGL